MTVLKVKLSRIKKLEGLVVAVYEINTNIKIAIVFDDDIHLHALPDHVLLSKIPQKIYR